MAERHQHDDPLAVALAAGRSVVEAADLAGVSPRTAYRRLADAAFSRRVAELRAEMVDRALGRLADAACEAVDVLRCLLAPSNPPRVRLNAAKAVLSELVRIKEATEIEQRLLALEDRARGEMAR